MTRQENLVWSREEEVKEGESEWGRGALKQEAGLGAGWRERQRSSPISHSRQIKLVVFILYNMRL